MPQLSDQEYVGMVRAMMADGMSLEDARKKTDAFENDAPEEVSPAATQTSSTPSKSSSVSEAIFGKSAQDAGVGQNLASGAAKGLTSTVLGIGELLNKAERATVLPIRRLFGQDTSAREQELNLQEQSAKQFSDRFLKPETFSEGAGYAGEQIGEFLTPLGGAGKATKAAEVVGEVANAAEKAPAAVRAVQTVGNILKGAAKAAPLATAQAGGDIEQGAENALTGEGIGLALRGLGNVAKKAGGAIYQKLVPTTAREAATAAGKGLNLGQAVSETPGILGIKGIFGSRAGLEQALESQAKELGNAVSSTIDDFARANPEAKFSTQALVDSATQKILAPENEANLMRNLGIDRTGLSEAKQAITDKLKQYVSAYGDSLTPQQAQTLKQEVQTGVKESYARSARGLPIKDTDVQAARSVASAARDAIMEAIPETGTLNKKLAPILESLDAFAKRGEYSGVLTDALAGSATAAGEFARGNFLGAMKNYVLGVLGKRAATSTLSRSATAKILSNLENLTNVPLAGQAARISGQSIGSYLNQQ